MVRLSVHYRQPIDVVMAWPAKHIHLLSAFLTREPPIEERIEALLARLNANYFNAHRGTNAPVKATDFLIPRDTWMPPETVSDRYSESDKKALAGLMNAAARVKK